MSDEPERSLRDRIAYQWELFSLAMGFFSRLPMPKNTPYSEERMNRSGRYFSTVGLLIGVLCGGVFLLLEAALPSAIAIFLMMSFSLMLTGAFHEDGLTDMDKDFANILREIKKPVFIVANKADNPTLEMQSAEFSDQR